MLWCWLWVHRLPNSVAGGGSVKGGTALSTCMCSCVYVCFSTRNKDSGSWYWIVRLLAQQHKKYNGGIKWICIEATFMKQRNKQRDICVSGLVVEKNRRVISLFCLQYHLHMLKLLTRLSSCHFFALLRIFKLASQWISVYWRVSERSFIQKWRGFNECYVRSARSARSACHLLSRWFLARIILRTWR
jgi:hypothetical protein